MNSYLGDSERIEHLADLLVSKTAKEPNTQVVTIDGAWGAGKTFAAERLMGCMEKAAEKEETALTLKVFRFDLLPFGNVNELIQSILSEIASRMWQENVINIKNEIRWLIGDATPKTNDSVAVAFGPMTITKKLSLSWSPKDQEKQLSRKFLKMRAKGYRLVILLDDLDRLRPAEIIAVMRMVESLQRFSGMVIILPYFRDVVASAIAQELTLDLPSSKAYLRKFRGDIVKVSPDFMDYKDKFISEFRKELPKKAEASVSEFEVSLAELVWYAVLHHIVLLETLDGMGDDPDGKKIAKYYPNETASPYLYTLYKEMEQNGKFHSKDVDIDAYAIEDNGRIKTFSSVYPHLSEVSDVANQRQNILSLLNKDVLMKPVYVSPEVRNLLKSSKGVGLGQDHDTVSQNAATRVVFHHILLRLLKETRNEPMLTDYYKWRDVEQLAYAIATDRRMKDLANITDRVALDRILATVKHRIIEFR